MLLDLETETATVPEITAPFEGATIFTDGPEVGVDFADGAGVGADVAFGEDVGLGADAPAFTVTIDEALPATAPDQEYPVAERV